MTQIEWLTALLEQTTPGTPEHRGAEHVLGLLMRQAVEESDEGRQWQYRCWMNERQQEADQVYLPDPLKYEAQIESRRLQEEAQAEVRALFRERHRRREEARRREEPPPPAPKPPPPPAAAKPAPPKLTKLPRPRKDWWDKEDGPSEEEADTYSIESFFHPPHGPEPEAEDDSPAWVSRWRQEWLRRKLHEDIRDDWSCADAHWQKRSSRQQKQLADAT